MVDSVASDAGQQFQAGVARSVREFRDAAIRVIAPPTCVLCRAAQDDPRCPGLCEQCADSIPWRAAARFDWTDAEFTDPSNRSSSRGVAPVCVPFRSATWFEEPVTRMVYALKYGRRFACARVLAEILAGHLRETELDTQLDALVPLPGFPLKTWARGVDPTRQITEHLGRLLHLPVLSLLRKVRSTPALGGVELPDRAAIVDGVFRSRAVPQPGVLRLGLVDDVLTTGATARSAARELLKQGAGRVLALAVASNAP